MPHAKSKKWVSAFLYAILLLYFLPLDGKGLEAMHSEMKLMLWASSK
jgi:hypothetical protein